MREDSNNYDRQLEDTEDIHNGRNLINGKLIDILENSLCMLNEYRNILVYNVYTRPCI